MMELTATLAPVFLVTLVLNVEQVCLLTYINIYWKHDFRVKIHERTCQLYYNMSFVNAP